MVAASGSVVVDMIMVMNQPSRNGVGMFLMLCILYHTRALLALLFAYFVPFIWNEENKWKLTSLRLYLTKTLYDITINHIEITKIYFFVLLKKVDRNIRKVENRSRTFFFALSHYQRYRFANKEKKDQSTNITKRTQGHLTFISI